MFSGIGKLTDYKPKLQIDQSKIPVAQKPRRVPFALQEKVTAKIEELVEKDIVERVAGPISWITYAVLMKQWFELESPCQLLIKF